MSNLKEITILYVEDENDTRETLGRLLKKWSAQVYLATNGIEGIDLFNKYNPDIIISDIRMPEKNGIEMMKEIRKLNEHIPVIFTTAHGESSYLHDAIKLKASSYLLKPISKNTLKEQLDIKAESILVERKKQQHSNMLQSIIDIDKNMVFATDNKKIHFANKTMLDFFQIKNSEVFSEKTKCFCEIFIEKDGYLSTSLINEEEKFYDLVSRTDEAKRVVMLFDFKTYTTKVFYVSSSKIYDENNNELNLFSLTDITKMSIEKIEIEHKAYYDKLTDVYNRAKIDEIIEYNIKLSQRYHNNFCIIVIDIDFFKKFNDKYGHQIGDEVLILLSKTVNNAVRKTDVFARWGGEEFLIVLPETDIPDALNVAKYLRKVVAKTEHKTAGFITASFGISQFRDGDNLDSIFKRADEALYKAKVNGRNRVELEKRQEEV